MNATARWARRAACAAIVSITISACGGSDTPDAASTSAPVATDPASDEPEATDEATTEPAIDESLDTITIDSVDELPDECVELMVDFLKEVEPTVESIDWSSATLDDLTPIMSEIEPLGRDMEEKTAAAGCDRYEFADEGDELEALREVAAEEAPGVAEWLTFLSEMSAAQEPGSSTDGPQNCDDAIAYLEDLVASGVTMTSLPISELSTVQQAVSVVSGTCDPAVTSEFFEREDVVKFLS